MSKGRRGAMAAKQKPETSAALDRIVAALERLGLASIAEYVRELHRRQSNRGGKE